MALRTHAREVQLSPQAKGKLKRIASADMDRAALIVSELVMLEMEGWPPGALKVHSTGRPVYLVIPIGEDLIWCETRGKVITVADIRPRPKGGS